MRGIGSCFGWVVEHGGFSAAARVIGDPKSSLGAAVQRLEAPGPVGLPTEFWANPPFPGNLSGFVASNASG